MLGSTLIRGAAAALSFCLLALAAGPAHAQRLDDPMRAMKLAPGETIRLDGKLDHPAWQRAPVHSGFIESAPRNGVPPTEETRVQWLYDERAVYVGVTVLDRTPERIRDDLVRNDLVNRTQDFIVVYVDAIGSKRSAQFFRVNAAGSTADGLHTAADDSEDFAPDFDWDAAVSRNPQGWTAVLRLPFASLRFAPGPQQWRAMVGRRLPRDDFHLFLSVTLPREAPSFIDRLQPLEGISLPENQSFLSVRPSVTLSRRRDQPSGVAASSSNDFDASLDIKWRPRAELVVDATLNPDFSQVALDVPQLAGNTRFALSLLEKRPFFFESADLLRSPTEAFYTRSFTEPRWGLRATWRGAQLAGSAFAIDDRGGGRVFLPGPYGTGIAEQPASRTVAARLRNDFGRLQLGAVLASRRYEGDRGDNQVLGPDLEWAIDDAWRLRTQWLRSDTTALGNGRGGLARRAAVGGQRGYLRLARVVNDAETAVTLEDIDAGFRHDSGFVNQAGIRKAEIYQRKTWLAVGPFHELSLNLDAFRVEDRATGRVVEEQFFPGLYATGAGNLEWTLELHGLARLRSAANAPLLQQRYVTNHVVFSPAGWFPLLDAKLDIGRLADTVANRVRPGLRWTFLGKLRLLPRLELEPTVSLATLREDGALRYRETVSQLLAVWHLGANSHLRAILQRSALDRRAEAGVATDRSARQAASLTWSWRRSAGTVLYLGASHQRDGAERPSRGSEAFVKLQFDIDEARADVFGPRR